MAAVLSGMALHGGVRPYGGTFLIFSDYMRPSIRLAAMMGKSPIYLFSHDSIGLGEDGPTHQPIGTLAALRSIPNMRVIRPADANDVVEAWREAIKRQDGPTAIVLTRQGVPVLDRSQLGSAAGLARGGYVLGSGFRRQTGRGVDGQRLGSEYCLGGPRHTGAGGHGGPRGQHALSRTLRGANPELPR